MLGNALGQFIGGAASDQIGRKPVILFGLGIFISSSVGISIATSIEQIQILRSIQALGGGFATVTCLALLRDVFDASLVSKKARQHYAHYYGCTYDCTADRGSDQPEWLANRICISHNLWGDMLPDLLISSPRNP